MNTRDVARNRCLGVQGRIYLVSTLLHCYRSLFSPMFFGHLHMLQKGGQAYLSKIFNIIDILLYPVSTIKHSMVGHGETIFKIKALRRPKNASLITVLANIVQIIPLTIRLFNYCTRVM